MPFFESLNYFSLKNAGKNEVTRILMLMRILISANVNKWMCVFPCILEWVKIAYDKWVWRVGLVSMLNMFWKQSENRNRSMSGSGAELSLSEWNAYAVSFHMGMISCLYIQTLRAEESLAASIWETWCTSLNLSSPRVWRCMYQIRN